MPKTKISEYSLTAANNTDIDGINLGEGMLPSDVNNAIRELMSQLKDFQGGTSGDALAVTAGGTGSVTTTGAPFALKGANSDITSITGLTTALAVNQGGTGQTTASAAFNALSPITTTGDLIVGNGTNSATRLGIGSNGTVLTSNGSTAAWAAAAGSLPVGAMQYFSGATSTTYPGSGWLKCDGSVVSQSTYSDLYNKLGTIPNGGESYTYEFPVIGMNISGGTNNPQSLTSGGHGSIRYVAAGSGIVSSQRGIATSTDAITWNVTKLPIGIAAAFCQYLNGKYVAVGNGGYVATSTDAITFTSQEPFTTNLLTNVVYGDKYVTAFGNGEIRTSTDAITWTARTSGTSTTLRAVAYNSATTQKYLAIGGTGTTNIVLSSTDAITWTSRSATYAGLFTCAATSTDATEKFVIGGNLTDGTVQSSTDGITWTSRTTGLEAAIQSLAHGGGRYIAISSGAYATSTNGQTWTATTVTNGTLRGVTHGNSLFVLADSGGGVYTSTNAAALSPTARTNYTALTYNGSNLFVVGGSSGTLRTSTNGITWTTRTSGTSSDIYDVVYGDRYVYVASGSSTTSGAVFTSTNAITWTSATTFTSTAAYGVAYVPTAVNKYVAVLTGNQISTSTDGITWTAAKFITNNESINTLIFSANDKFYLPGISAQSLFFSTDGIWWQSCSFKFINLPTSALAASQVRGIIYANNKYYMASTSNWCAQSDDGLTWSVYNIPYSIQKNVVYVNGVFYAVESFGIIKSNDFINWEMVEELNTTIVSSSIGINTLAASSDYLVLCANSNLLAYSSLYTYNKSTEFVVPEANPANLASGTETLYIKSS